MSSDRRLRPLRRAWTAARLAAFAVRQRRQLTAIHANGLKELSLSLPAALVSRVPLVVWVHNFALPPSVRWFGWLWRLVLPRCDVRWAAVSPARARPRGRRPAGDAPTRSRSCPTRSTPTTSSPRSTVGGPTRSASPTSARPGSTRGSTCCPTSSTRSGDQVPVQWLVFSRQTDDDLDATWQRLRTMAGNGRVSIEGKFPDVRAGVRPL